MSQHDLDIANQGFPATRADLNNALKALGSTNSGATAPSTTYANQLWYDTANNILKIRNEDNDAFIDLIKLDQSNDNIEAMTISNLEAALTITTADNEAQLTLKSTDADANSGPILHLFRDSASPADSDVLGQIKYIGRNDAAEEIVFGKIDVVLNDASDGTEDAEMRFLVATAGDNPNALKLGSTETVFNDSSHNVDFRVESDGNAHMLFVDASTDTVLMGKSASDLTTPGVEIAADGKGAFTRDSNTPLIVNRQTDNGKILELRKNNGYRGALGLETDGFFIDGESAHAGLTFGANQIVPRKDGALIDDTIDVGSGTYRFDDIRATNGTIQTSDQNEKQQIASLTDAEISAAKAISKLFKTFKWNDSVAEKGDAARTHTGVIAQEVEQAMTDAGLNAGDYAFFISTTWWEADETYTDDDGVEQTRTNTYDTAEEAPEGATERNRKGIRYPQLLSFIGAATEQRLASIEARLDALEA